MEVEDIVRNGVLDQDHLADLLIGHESKAEEIRGRVLELLEQGAIDIYTYASEGSSPIPLEKSHALSVAEKSGYWSWRSASGKEQLYFLAPVRLSNGALAYGA